MPRRSFISTLSSIPEQRDREHLSQMVYATEGAIERYELQEDNPGIKTILALMKKNVAAIRQCDRDLQILQKEKMALKRQLQGAEQREHDAEMDEIHAEFSLSDDDCAVVPDGELSKSDLAKLMNKEIERQLKLEEKR